MSTLTQEELSRLTNHQRRAYEAGKLSAEAVRMKGWLGSSKKGKAKKATAGEADTGG